MPYLLKSIFALALLVGLAACSSDSDDKSADRDDVKTDMTEDEQNDTVVLPPFASEEIIFEGLTYKTVQSPYTGRVWLDRNMGASKLCESIDDAACFGGLYQWGRPSDGHEDNESQTTDVKSDTIDNAGNKFIVQSEWTTDEADGDGSLRSWQWSKSDGSSVCPVGFRVPTIDELSLEAEKGSLSTIDIAYASFWNLPAGKYRGYLGPVVSDNGLTCLWSVTLPLDEALTYHANPLCLDHDEGYTTTSNTYHGMGHHIRCIKP